MNPLCQCGCLQYVRPGNRYVYGHYARTQKKSEFAAPPEEKIERTLVGSRTSTPPRAAAAIQSIPGAPPPYPHKIDHTRWNVAEEPLGTDLNTPWELARCVDCREPMWRHNPKADMCESCYYRMVDDHWQQVNKQARTIALNPHDPFAR